MLFRSSLGIPCFTADEAALGRLLAAAEKDPNAQWTVDVEAGKVKGPIEESASLPPGPKSQFLSGRWNSLNELLLNVQGVETVAAGLPYVSGW